MVWKGEQMIIFIVGKIGSGKSTIAKQISDLTDFPFFNISDFVKQSAEESLAKGKGILDRKVLQAELDKHKNPDWLFDRIHKKTKALPNFILVGPREPYLIYKFKELKAIHKKILFVLVRANQLVRYERICKRDGHIYPPSFKREEQRDETLGLDIIMSGDFDTHIDTDGSGYIVSTSINVFLTNNQVVPKIIRKSK